LKRSAILIILYALSLGNSLAQIILQSRRIENLEEEVSLSLKNLFKLQEKFPYLQEVPEWLGSAMVECARTYQDYGVDFFHLKTGIYYLTIVAVILMFLWKKPGFWLYVIAQILGVLAVFLAIGFNVVALGAALLVGLISYLFIRLYKKHFYVNLN